MNKEKAKGYGSLFDPEQLGTFGAVCPFCGLFATIKKGEFFFVQFFPFFFTKL
jgi:hypothetical protein